MIARALNLVPTPPEKKPRADLHDYESEQRQHIARTDWAALHIRADRRAPIYLTDTRKRSWLA